MLQQKKNMTVARIYNPGQRGLGHLFFSRFFMWKLQLTNNFTNIEIVANGLTKIFTNTPRTMTHV